MAVATDAALAQRGAAALHRRPGLRVGGLLALPMLWLVVGYIGALTLLFVTAFWTIDDFSGQVTREFTLDNFANLFTTPAYRGLVLRTLGIAAAVTVLCAVLGVPVSFFVARVAPSRYRPLLIALLVTPLWASYLVKVYAWRAMLEPNTGVVAWMLAPFGGESPGFGTLAIVLTLTYLWLPYMILPVYAGLERLPDSLLDASADLGARPGRTMRSIVMPSIKPALAAGSIFTFSLSLGDYITAKIVGGKVTMIGNVVEQNYVTNLPFAAAMATIPVLIMVVYLLAVRRTGALDNL
jgi:putative spermidine/putrescine transport system permease protein